MGRTPKITPKQEAVLDALDELALRNKLPPSLHELMQAVDTRSTSTMGYQLRAGVRVGRVVEVITIAGKKYAPVWWWKMVNAESEAYYEERK